MAELAIPYSIVGPDGTRVVLGQGDIAKADPDWIGWLDPDNPLAVSRSIRGGNEAKVEDDGALAGPRYHDSASLVMRGQLDPNATVATVIEYERRLRRATAALRQDCVLRYTPSGQAPRAWWLRRSADPDIAGRRPKTFQLAFESASPYAMSYDEESTLIVPGQAAGEIGFSSPISDPLTSEIGVSGQTTIDYQGDVDAWPRFRVTGPITNPRIVNNSLGLEVRLITTLGASSWVDVYPALGRVLLNGSTDRYRYYDRVNSRWWKLRRGVNDVRLLASSYSGGAGLTVYWRRHFEE